MNKEWQEKLTSFGATVDSEGHIRFADESEQSGNGVVSPTTDEPSLLVDLSHLSVVDFTGDDAKTFLQAQVCNDLTLMSDNAIQINGYCSPKGRLLALFTVFAHEDGYRLVLPHNVVDSFTKRLQMFVMRAQVSIRIRSDLICSGLVLDAALKPATVAMPEGTPTLPASELQLSQNQTMQILRWHDAPSVESPESVKQGLQQRYLCISEQSAMSALWSSDAFRHRSYPYWRWGDINAGIPNVFASSTDQFIPQMVNLHLINALSFKKGCYPGQEIIARLQYLGKSKKHMKHLRVKGASEAAAPGAVLTTDSNNNAGQVVDAILDEGGLNLLAVVNIETNVSELKLGELGLAEAPLPYALLVDDEQVS